MIRQLRSLRGASLGDEPISRISASAAPTTSTAFTAACNWSLLETAEIADYTVSRYIQGVNIKHVLVPHTHILIVRVWTNNHLDKDRRFVTASNSRQRSATR